MVTDSPALTDPKPISRASIAIIVFFVITNVTSTLSQNWLMGALLGALAGAFTFKFLPSQIRKLEKPLPYSPHEDYYFLTMDRLLKEVNSSLAQKRKDIDQEWHQINSDPEYGAALFQLKYNEGETDSLEPAELLLKVRAYQDPRSTEITFLNLSYWQTSQENSTKSQVLAEQTTNRIYSRLKQFKKNKNI